MGRIGDAFSTFNTTVRTLLATVVVGGLGYGGWLGYNKFYEAERAQAAYQKAQEKLKELQATIDSQKQLLAEKERKIQSLSASLRLLKFNRRVARLRVLKVITDPDSGQKLSEIEFVELTDDATPIGQPKRFTLKGDLVYVDYWVVKFDDKYIEQGVDIDRSTSLCLFRRIFGEYQEPKDGFALDEPYSQPLSYARGGKLSPLEERIWSDFWSVANDLQKQQELGIRAAHGEAVSIKVIEGQTYRLQLRASDGLSIVPESQVATGKPSA